MSLSKYFGSEPHNVDETGICEYDLGNIAKVRSANLTKNVALLFFSILVMPKKSIMAQNL